MSIGIGIAHTLKETNTMDRRPVGYGTIITMVGFLVGKTKTHALVLENSVWAISVKKIKLKEFQTSYKPLVLNEDDMMQRLNDMAKYAGYVGMTAEAADYLPLLYPMTQEEIYVAKTKGKETQARHTDQAIAEEKKERPLAGAALKARNARLEREAADSQAEVDNKIVEPGTSTNATERAGIKADDIGTDEPKMPRVKITPSTVDRRRTGKKATEARELAKEVTEALTEIEAEGGNPADVLSKAKPKPKKTKSTIDKRFGPKPFDAAKLKGPDNSYKSASAMFKSLIIENEGKKKPKTDDEIFADVKTTFGIDDSKRGYVGWNRNWLKKQGII